MLLAFYELFIVSIVYRNAKNALVRWYPKRWNLR